MKLVLLGTGRMGREVERLARSEGHEVVSLNRTACEDGRVPPAALQSSDVVVDFTRGDSVLPNLESAGEAGVPVVVGTTGWYDGLPAARDLVARHGTGLVWGANFSIGANLLMRLVSVAAAALAGFPEFDAYVQEHHHRDKRDAPSGTGRRLAERILAEMESKRDVQTGNPEGAIARDAVHLASIRAGAEFGRHKVGFDAPAESLELIHTARSREGFARGALFAAEWIRNRKGVYEFFELLSEPM